MSYNTTILADTPTAFYENEDDGAGLVMSDASGNSLDGAYSASGVTYEQPGPLLSETSKAVTFDGAAGTASVNITTPTYPFCLEAWVNPATVADNDRLVYISDAGAGDAAFIGVGTGGTVWQIGYEGSGNTRTKEGGTVGSGWQNLSARFLSATERYLYHNGVLIASDTLAAGVWTGSAYTLYVGSNAGSSNFLNATVSRAAYYNADMSTARITEHYRAGVLNPLTLPMVTLKNMLASSYTWQAEVGAATAEAAKARIEFIGMAPPSGVDWLDNQPSAYTWLSNDDPARWSSIGQGTGPALFPSARSIGLTLYRKTPASDTATLDDASVGFLSWVGAIIDELKTAINAGGTSVLLADSISIIQWYRASAKRANTEGDYHRADILISWYGGVGA